MNAAQSAAMHRLQGVADALFKDGDIIRDAGIIVNKETGEVRAQSGAVYLRGAVRGVPEATFTIPVVGTVAVGIRLTQRVVSELEDPALYNPAIGSRGEGEPGAWRLQVNAAWGFDGDNGDGEFYVVYTVDDGELRAKEAPPTLDTFTQSIARYDRDSTAGGSYIVDGLTVLMAGDDADGHQVYTVSEGRARVNGYGVDMPTSRRLTYAAVPDLRRIDTEVHTADAASTQSGGQRITVARPAARRRGRAHHHAQDRQHGPRQLLRGRRRPAGHRRRSTSSSAVRVIPSTRRGRTTKERRHRGLVPHGQRAPPPGLNLLL